MVAGVWMGSALWWLALTTGVGLMRHHFSVAWRRRINLLSGVLLAGFALWQWAGALGRLHQAGRTVWDSSRRFPEPF